LYERSERLAFSVEDNQYTSINIIDEKNQIHKLLSILDYPLMMYIQKVDRKQK